MQVSPKEIWSVIKTYYPDPQAPDERYRRLSTIKPLLMRAQQEDWAVAASGLSHFTLMRDRDTRRAGILRQQISLDISKGELARSDTLEGIDVRQMPEGMRHRALPNVPYAFTLTTRIRGAPGSEIEKTEYAQHVLWSDEKDSVVRQFGGTVFVEDTPTHERGGGTLRTWVDIGVTADDRFSQKGFIMDHLSLRSKSLGGNRIGTQEGRPIPLGLLTKFHTIFGESPVGQSLDTVGNLFRGWMHGAINAPDIPDHPALRACPQVTSW